MMRMQATSFIKICRRLKASKHVKYQTEIPIIHVCLSVVLYCLMTLLNMMLTYMTYDIEYCGIQSRAGRIRLNIIHLSNKKGT